MNDKITGLLRKQNVRLEKIYYCPHAPEDQCVCRKPKPFLILKAAGEFDVDLSKSFFVGDHVKDIEVGRAAGVTTVFVGSLKASPDADISVVDIFEAAEKIISHEKLRKPL